MTLETRQVLLPEPAVFLRPLRYFLNSRGLELVDALPSVPLFVDETCGPENPQVLRYRGAAHPESRRELIHRRRTLSQAIENGSPRRISDGVEDVRVCGLTVHESICNLSVTYRQGLFRLAIFREL